MSICTKSFAIFNVLMDYKIMHITNFNNPTFPLSVENQDNIVNFLSFHFLSVSRTLSTWVTSFNHLQIFSNHARLKDAMEQVYHPRLPSFRSSQRRYSIMRAVLKTFVIFTGKHLCWSLSFLLSLQHRCFCVNIAKVFRTSTLRNICEWLLLQFDLFNLQSILMNSKCSK